MSRHEWAMLTAALLLLLASFKAGLILASALERLRTNPDQAFRRFLAGRWWQ